MKFIKSRVQYLEWVALFFFVSPYERILLTRRARLARAQAAPREASLPVLERGLMLVIVVCVAFVTTCLLWFVSQGWAEALFAVPLFIISVFVALLYGGLKARFKRARHSRNQTGK